MRRANEQNPTKNKRNGMLIKNLRVCYTAVDAVEKKLGGMSGKNVDPQKYRAQNEKLTDKIRGFLEKATGKKVCVFVY